MPASESGISTFPERFDVPQIGAERARQGRVDVHVAFNKPGKGVEGGEQEARPRASGVSSCMETSPMCRSGMGFSASRGDFPEDRDAGVCFDALPDEGGVP